MSNFQPDIAKNAALKFKTLLLQQFLTLNNKCVKNCYTMQIYLKKKILQ